MLEKNKIYNEDCILGLEKLDDNSIDLVISDIPYGINYDEWDVIHTNTNSALLGKTESMKNTSFKSRGKPINGWNEEDKKIPLEYQKWCQKWLKEIYRVTKEGSPIILFSSRRLLHRLNVSLEDEGFIIRDVLIWEKDKCNGRAQRINNVLHKRGIYDSDFDNYRIGNLKPVYEPIVWAMKPYKKTLTDCVIENKIGGFYCEDDKIPDNILRFSVNKKNELHPTQKPIELMKELVKLFSISKEHVILDPFMGSGTTAIACLEMNRNFIGFELNQKYWSNSQERIEKWLKENQKK